MNFINRAFLFWLITGIIFTPVVLLFEISAVSRLYYILTNNYAYKNMLLTKTEVSEHRQKNTDRAVTLYGLVGSNKEVYSYFFLNEATWEDYIDTQILDNNNLYDNDSLATLNIKIPVIQFGKSNFVLLIKKNQTEKEALNKWFCPKFLIFTILYLPLIILFILKKNYGTKTV